MGLQTFEDSTGRGDGMKMEGCEVQNTGEKKGKSLVAWAFQLNTAPSQSLKAQTGRDKA